MALRAIHRGAFDPRWVVTKHREEHQPSKHQINHYLITCQSINRVEHGWFVVINNELVSFFTFNIDSNIKKVENFNKLIEVECLPRGRIEGHGAGFVQINFDDSGADSQRAVAQEDQLFGGIQEVPIIRRPVQRYGSCS